MSTLLTAIDLEKSYADHHLFTDVTISISAGDRIGLIGPNGSGKSTLLKILAGLVEPGEGEITRKRNLRVSYIAQDDLFEPTDTPLTAATRAAHDHHTPAHALDPDTLAAIALSKLAFTDLDQPVATLSGGWRKRLSLACALATDPDVMMLDEPTNHLDVEGVQWLENFVIQSECAMVLITHDRTFLNRTANRIIELSRAYPNGTFQTDSDYSEFLRRKNEFLDAQKAQQTVLASLVRRDNAWLLQGIQGRQTRNKSQVAAAAERKEELTELRKRNRAPIRTTSIEFNPTERKTVKLVAAKNIAKTLGTKQLFSGIDLTLSPKMKLGLLGPNGSGKSTLLRVIAKDLEPDTGTVKYANDLRLITFTQHRESLNPKLTLKQALCPNGHTVVYNGKSMHVTGWAGKFLFEPRQLMTPVGNLSGGEQARVQLATLMLTPADVLILDEPTNDLDIPSLEVLEQALLEFPGALILVTHDRFMLQRVSNTYLALDGRGNARPFASYRQWETFSTTDNTTQDVNQSSGSQSKQPAESSSSDNTNTPTKRKKLSYKLQRELDTMEETILTAEDEAAALEAKAAEPNVIADHQLHAKICGQLSDLHDRIAKLYHRWQELEAMQLDQSSEN